MSVTKATATTSLGRELVRTKYPGIFERGGGYVIRFRDPSGTQRSARRAPSLRPSAFERSLRPMSAVASYRPDTRVTFTAYADQWIDSSSGRTGRGLRAETLNEYRRDLGPAKKHFGRTKLSAVSPADVKAYARGLAADGLKPATVRRKLAPVKALFATAVEDGVDPVEPNHRCPHRLTGR